MKGISPMIAVVLLIAFVVAIGTIVSLFLTGLAGTIVGVTTPEAERIARCGPSVLTIQEVYYDSADFDPLRVRVAYDSGMEPLSSFVVTLINVNREFNSTTLDVTMKVGEVRTFTEADLTNKPPVAKLEEVRVTGYCLETYPVSATCRSEEPCMVKA
jgi:flagellin-like protein